MPVENQNIHLSAIKKVNMSAVFPTKILMAKTPDIKECVHAFKVLASCFLMGTGLGLLGAVLIACAIPILACMPHLPQ